MEKVVIGNPNELKDVVTYEQLTEYHNEMVSLLTALTAGIIKKIFDSGVTAAGDIDGGGYEDIIGMIIDGAGYDNLASEIIDGGEITRY